MIKYGDAEKLLRKHIRDPKVLEHSKGVSDFALMLAKKIGQNHPELKIDKEKIRIVALLHDIGKEYEEGHEERSLDILREEGLGEIARISKHGFLYLEELGKKGGGDSAEEIENKIIVYSDMRFKFSPRTIEERLEEAKTGWKGSPEEIESKVKYLRSFILKLEKEIFELAGEEV